MTETGKGELRDWHQLLWIRKSHWWHVIFFLLLLWRCCEWFVGLIILCSIFKPKHHKTALVCQWTPEGTWVSFCKEITLTLEASVSFLVKPIWYSKDPVQFSPEDLLHRKLLFHKLQNHSYINLGNGFLLWEFGNTAPKTFTWLGALTKCIIQ